MRNATRFCLNFAIGFLLLSIFSLGFLLISHAPMPIGGSIARVGLNKSSTPIVYIPGYKFVCNQERQLNQCEFNLQGQPLKITLAYTDAEQRWEIERCQVNYAGLTGTCTTNFHSIVVSGWLPDVSIESNLGLSPQQLAEVQKQESQDRNIIAKLSEGEFGLLTIILAIAMGFTAGAASLLHFGRFVKAIAIICFGILMSRFTLGLLGGISFVAAESYGLSPNQLMQLVILGSIASGIISIIIATYLLWSRNNQFVKGLVIFINGFGIFGISWFFFLVSLLGLGYVD